MPMQQILAGLGAKVVEHTVSDGDTNLNASTIFGSDFADAVSKVIIISSGHEIGAVFPIDDTITVGVESHCDDV